MIVETKVTVINHELMTIKHVRKHDSHRVVTLGNRSFTNLKPIKVFFRMLKQQGIQTVNIDYSSKTLILIKFSEDKSKYYVNNVYYNENGTVGQHTN